MLLTMNALNPPSSQTLSFPQASLDNGGFVGAADQPPVTHRPGDDPTKESVDAYETQVDQLFAQTDIDWTGLIGERKAGLRPKTIRQHR
jgi:hypothetical protein